MKGFFKKAGDAFTIAGDKLNGKDGIQDEPEIAEMFNKAKDIKQNAKELLNQIKHFQSYAKDYYKSMSKIGEIYPVLLVESPQKPTADSAQNALSSVAEVGNTFSQFRLQKFCIDPLQQYFDIISNVVKLGDERHGCLVLKDKADKALEAAKSKNEKSETITKRTEEANKRKEDLDQADRAFRESFERDVKENDILTKVFNAYLFYVEEMNRESIKRLNDNLSSFNMDSFTGEFKSITDNSQ